MNGKELYGIFKGIRLHFTQKAYDYPTYGPSKVSETEFAKVFTLAGALTHKFKTREALEHRLVAIFKNKPVWLNEINSPEAIRMEREHTAALTSFTYNFENEIRLISESVSCMIDAFKPRNSLDIPPVARMLISGDISIETFCALDMLMEFSKGLNDVVWKGERLRVEKYKAFFRPDIVKVVGIAKPYFKQ